MAANTGQSVFQAGAIIGPFKGSVVVQSVDSATVVHIDMQTAFSFGSKYSERLFSITSGQPMGFLFSDGSTDAIDLTAVAGDTRCDRLAANERRECYPSGRYLHLLAESTTDYVRVAPSSP